MFVLAEKKEGECGETQSKIADAYRTYAEMGGDYQEMNKEEPRNQSHIETESKHSTRYYLEDSVQMNYGQSAHAKESACPSRHQARPHIWVRELGKAKPNVYGREP